VSASIIGSFRFESAATAVVFSAYGLTATWYYSGAGDAKGLLLCEAMPRFVATAVAALMLWYGGDLLCYPVLLGVAVVASNLLNSRRVMQSTRFPWRWEIGEVQSQLPATLARFINGLYGAGSTSAVGVVAPSLIFEYAAITRIQRPALSASAAVPQGLMSWVAGAPGHLKQRQQLVLLFDFAVAIALGALLYIVLPSVADLMFAGLLIVSPILNMVTSLGVATGFMARALLMHGLTTADLGSFGSALLTITSVVGLAGTIVAAVTWGAVGALGAFAGAEAVFCIFAGVRLWIFWRRPDEYAGAEPSGNGEAVPPGSPGGRD
jgi:PST family polysaccharide transporter